MMSFGFRPSPEILLDRLVEALAVVGHVDRQIDDGPVETMPNMSPSWTRSFEIFLNSSRMRPVLRKSRCRSSTKIRKMRPGGVVRRPRRRQDDALLHRRRRRRREVGDASAVHEDERDDVLLDAVFEDL